MNQDSIIKTLVIVIVALLACTLLMLGAWGIVALVTDAPPSDKPSQGGSGTIPGDTPLIEDKPGALN